MSMMPITWRRVPRYVTPQEYERSILDKYSTRGLRRTLLDREAKREHLAKAYGIKGAVAERILDEMYGPKL